MIPWNEYIETFESMNEAEARIEAILDDLGVEERSLDGTLTEYGLNIPGLPIEFTTDEPAWHDEGLFICGILDTPAPYHEYHEQRERLRARLPELRFCVFHDFEKRYYHLIWGEDITRPDEEARRQIEEVMGFKNKGYGACHRTYSLDGCFFTLYYVPDFPPIWTTSGEAQLESIEAMRAWISKQRGMMEKWEYLRRTLGWP